MTADMLSWTRQQIETRKALAEAASGESWTAQRVMDVGYMVADKDSGTAVARLWVEMGDLVDGFHSAGVNPLDTSKHIAFNDPRQVLADCEADLGLLDEHAVEDTGFSKYCRVCSEYSTKPGESSELEPAPAPCRTVRLVAARYRHRPGFLPEWAPERITT